MNGNENISSEVGGVTPPLLPNVAPSPMITPKPSFGGKNKVLIIGIVVLAIAAVFGYVWFQKQMAAPTPAAQAAAYFQKGKASFNEGNFKDAKDNFILSSQLDSTNPQTYAYLGAIEYPDSQGKKDSYLDASYEKAAENYEKALTLGLTDQGQGYWNVVENLGYIYNKLKRYDDANQKFMQIAFAQRPNADWARYNVASDYFNRLNKPEDARKILSSVMNGTTTLPASRVYSVNFLWAELYAYFKDYSNAEKYARLAIATNYSAKNAPADIILSYALAGRGERVLFEKEVEATRKKIVVPAEFDCYVAEGYTLLHDYSKAIVSANKVDSSSVSSVHAWCVRALGIAHLARGDKNKAKEYLKNFVKMMDALEMKNAFLMREYGEATKELAGLEK